MVSVLGQRETFLGSVTARVKNLSAVLKWKSAGLVCIGNIFMLERLPTQKIRMFKPSVVLIYRHFDPRARNRVRLTYKQRKARESYTYSVK